jgi:hypothetical protein
MKTNRRVLLALIVLASTAAGSPSAWAKDGDSGGDSGGSDSSGGDDSSSDDSDDDSSSGQGRGRGRGGDDDSDDGDDGDDGDDKAKEAEKAQKDHDKARDAVKSGKAVPLKKLRAHLAAKYPGRLVKVELKQRLGNFVYKVRLLQSGNKLKSLTFDAATLQVKLF